MIGYRNNDRVIGYFNIELGGPNARTKSAVRCVRGRDIPDTMSLCHIETNLRHAESSLPDCQIVHT